MKTEKEFIGEITELVNGYIENFDRYDSNPQLRINPLLKRVELINGADMGAEIEDADEAVENAAIAQNPATEDADDRQVRQNPDFYPVKNFLKPSGNTDIPDAEKIAHLAAKYF